MAADHALKILAIEDDRDTQANLRDILELDGYCVEGATSVKEVLARADWGEFAIILLDRRLPDGSADSLLPQLRQLAPEAAVIIVTAWADLDGTLTALRHGATDYLLKPINPDLLRTAMARVAKLKAAEERAVQAERLAAIGQMMTVLTHESGNALARARVCLDMLAEEVADRPEAVQLIERTRWAQDDLQRLYEEVRNYAAPVSLEPEPWDVGAVWRQAWTSLTEVRPAREAAIREETDGVDRTCAVDPFRLMQVFRNLFENALAACPSPVCIEIRCSEAELEGRPALRIAVRDNGPGLTPEQRQLAFEPFYTTKTKGTGLGLASARRIVEAHGGQIAVGENGGPGAEFVVLLPRGPA
jgi:signal transduction histidine kinase